MIGLLKSSRMADVAKKHVCHEKSCVRVVGDAVRVF